MRKVIVILVLLMATAMVAYGQCPPTPGYTDPTCDLQHSSRLGNCNRSHAFCVQCSISGGQFCQVPATPRAVCDAQLFACYNTSDQQLAGCVQSSWSDHCLFFGDSDPNCNRCIQCPNTICPSEPCFEFIDASPGGVGPVVQLAPDSEIMVLGGLLQVFRRHLGGQTILSAAVPPSGDYAEYLISGQQPIGLSGGLGRALALATGWAEGENGCVISRRAQICMAFPDQYTWPVIWVHQEGVSVTAADEVEKALKDLGVSLDLVVIEATMKP